jgi:hypothetical protein
MPSFQFETELIRSGLNLLTVYWNVRQKRRELNLTSLHAFHGLYGDFKELVKIWRLAKRKVKSPVQVPADERWKLLTRACALESRSEALVLRLATERLLSKEQIEAIGLFRQAIQSLRESIREDVDARIGSRRTEYKLLNQLAAEIASFMSVDPPERPPCSQRAQYQLEQIAVINSRVWKRKVDLLRMQKRAARTTKMPNVVRSPHEGSVSTLPLTRPARH